MQFFDCIHTFKPITTSIVITTYAKISNTLYSNSIFVNFEVLIFLFDVTLLYLIMIAIPWSHLVARSPKITWRITKQKLLKSGQFLIWISKYKKPSIMPIRLKLKIRWSVLMKSWEWCDTGVQSVFWPLSVFGNQN